MDKYCKPCRGFHHVPIAERSSPMSKSPSQWPGTDRSSAFPGRSLISTTDVTCAHAFWRARALGTGVLDRFVVRREALALEHSGLGCREPYRLRPVHLSQIREPRFGEPGSSRSTSRLKFCATKYHSPNNKTLAKLRSYLLVQLADRLRSPIFQVFHRYPLRCLIH